MQNLCDIRWASEITCMPKWLNMISSDGLGRAVFYFLYLERSVGIYISHMGNMTIKNSHFHIHKFKIINEKASPQAPMIGLNQMFKICLQSLKHRLFWNFKGGSYLHDDIMVG